MSPESSLTASALVLAHVPPKPRFSTACLVSSGLRRAAFAATSVLELKQLRGQHADAFAAFLRQHGQRLSVLKVSFQSGSPVVPAFEAHGLQRLQLAGCTLQLQQQPPADSLLSTSTQLTLLELAQVTVQGPQDSLSALAVLPKLQHLALQAVKMHSPDTLTGDRPLLRLPGAALQALTDLTALRVSAGPSLAQDALQHISCLAKLQHLVLHNAISSPLSPATAPGFSALKALTTCSLYEGSVDPSVLLSCTRLVELQLRHLNQHNGAVASGGRLLQLLSALPSLQHLEVANSRFSWPQEDTEAFSAFTSSSALQHLQLEDCCLPPSIWQHAFPPGRQLPQLQKLLALDGRGDRPADSDVVLRGASLSAADVSSIVGCCQELQQMAVTLRPDVPLSVLTTLTGLTTLEVYGVSTATIASLAQVTTLQDMNLTLRQGVTGGKKALLPLTALTRLNYLSCDDSLAEAQPAARGGREYDPLELQNLAPDGEPSDLWQQLQRICEVQIETPATPSVQELHG